MPPGFSAPSVRSGSSPAANSGGSPAPNKKNRMEGGGFRVSHDSGSGVNIHNDGQQRKKPAQKRRPRGQENWNPNNPNGRAGRQKNAGMEARAAYVEQYGEPQTLLEKFRLRQIEMAAVRSERDGRGVGLESLFDEAPERIKSVVKAFDFMLTSMFNHSTGHRGTSIKTAPPEQTTTQL